MNNKLCCQLSPLRGCKKCDWLICKTCYVTARDEHAQFRAKQARAGLVSNTYNVVAQHDAVSNHPMNHTHINKTDIVCYDNGLQ